MDSIYLDGTISFLGIHPGEIQVYVFQKTTVRMFIVEIFVIETAKMSIERKIYKLNYIYVFSRIPYDIENDVHICVDEYQIMNVV